MRSADLVVFDVDGTLYDQRGMRARMAVDLALACIARPSTFGDVRVLRTYRRMREALAGAPGSVDAALEQTAESSGRTLAEVTAIESEWLQRRPLRHLGGLASPCAASLMESLRREGVSLAVWSDYPCDDKLSELGLAVDHVVSSHDEDVRALKPSPSGLEKAMRLASVSPDRTVFVGDRDERDGASARAAGTRFVCVPRGLTRDACAAVEAEVLGDSDLD